MLDDYHLIDDPTCTRRGAPHRPVPAAAHDRADHPGRSPVPPRPACACAAGSARSGPATSGSTRPRPPPSSAPPPPDSAASASTTCASAPRAGPPGLVLAGLSLERTDDADRFVGPSAATTTSSPTTSPTSCSRCCEDEERRRMVEAAVLHRLSGPLLDAVTGSHRRRALARTARRRQPARDPTRRGRRVVPLPPPVPRPAPARGEALDRRPLARAAPARRGLVRDVRSPGRRRGPPARGRRPRARDAPDAARRAGPPRQRAVAHAAQHPRAAVHRRRARRDLLAAVGVGPLPHRPVRHAQQLLDRATATLPADVEPMRTMPLRINLALGTADVGDGARGGP